MFEDRAEKGDCFLIRLEKAILKLINNVASQMNLTESPFTQFDAGVLMNWPLIKFRPANGLLRVNPQRMGEGRQVWDPPDKGWTKVNFGGASRGNPRVYGAGVIAQDDCGNILAIGAKRLMDGSNNKAECQVALEAILMTKKMGVKKLHLEGDSQIV